MIVQAVLSFKNYRLADGIWHSPWVGLAHFTHIFAMSDFHNALQNTIVISMLRIGIGFLPPLVLAIFLYDLYSAKLRRISQTIVYIPHFFSMVIVYGIVFALFSNLGIVNQMIERLGGTTVNFLLSPGWFKPLLIGSAVWKELGWGTIIYLAGLSAINPSLFEAATIDGAGPWRRIWHVTLPNLKPLMIFLLTLSLGNILYAGGEQVLLFYNPATYGVGDIIDTWVYREGLGQMQYGVASAAQLFQSLFGLALVLGVNKLSKKLAGVGIW
ncbi:ABC transporter permease [Paenibacillus cymbidii]|uniref:ABC transporter permease n=1 Tax=Paenibacillus cymbidii TaxID=1639034 RepID=UPI0010811267|nr:ABC transporter permease subunit [Paenibacillus cymbidii]